MPELRTHENGSATLVHLDKTPTVTIKVPQSAVVRFLTDQMPYVEEPVATEHDHQYAVERRFTRVHSNDRWLSHYKTKPQPPWYNDSGVADSNHPGYAFYNNKGIGTYAWDSYQILGKTPHLDTPDVIMQWDDLRPILGWHEMDSPLNKLPENGCYMYQIDTGWFEAVEAYGFLYGNDDHPNLHMEHPDFPVRYRKDCLLTSLLREFITADSRFSYGSDRRDSNIPLLRATFLVGFHGHSAIIGDVKVKAFFDRQDIGFAIDMTTGEFTDLGDPAEEEFQANVHVRGRWFLPSYIDHARKGPQYNTLLPGMRFSDLFNDHGQRGVAEAIVAQSVEWNDSISCDTPGFPFGAIAGYRRIKRTTPENYGAWAEHYDSACGLIMGVSTTIKSVVDTLRTNFDVGTTLRYNGIALTSTADAVKNEDHHILECVSKGTVIPKKKRRWSSGPDEHKRVYTVENAETFKPYLVEGQDRNANAASNIPGMNRWTFLLSVGKIAEDFDAWIKKAAKGDNKLLNQWERKNPGNSIEWIPFSWIINVKLEVT